MLRSPTVRNDELGNTVLVKHATGSDCSRLRHEAELLNTIRNEGVVTAIGFEESEERCELRLRYLEAATVAEHPPLRCHDMLDFLIAVGTTIAELHQEGIRHGAVNRDHVLLARPLRPVLCGFGSATGPTDPQQHQVGVDLAGIAAIAETELARTNRIITGAAERRDCSDALSATRDLAASAERAPNDDAALHTWISRLETIRHEANPVPLNTNARGPHLAPEVGPSGGDRRRIAAAAAAVALVGVVFVGWRVLAGGERDHHQTSPLIPTEALTEAPTGSAVDAGINSGVAVIAAETDPPESEDLKTTASQPPAPVSALGASEAPEVLGASEAPGTEEHISNGATLLYGTALYDTAHTHCAKESQAEADGNASDGNPINSDVDCVDEPPLASSNRQTEASRLTLRNGQWALAGEDDLAALSCDVVVVHYGELSIESPQPAPSEPDWAD